VIGGFSVGLDGSFQFRTAAEGDRADWLTLRARTTAASLATDESASELAHSSATAAWRSLSYDAGTYNAPFFRPSTQHIEAASRFGIALCGRGNASAKNLASDADVVHIDESVASSALGMSRQGGTVLLSNASVVIGFMFGAEEVATAAAPSPNGAFLKSDEHAPPHPSVLFCEESSEKELEVAAAEPVPNELESALNRLLADPINKVYARVLRESPSKATLDPPPAPVESDLERPDADRASGALRAAIGAVIKTSPFAMDDVVQRIADTSSLWHTARAPGAAAVLHARQVEYLSAFPARRLYASLDGHGARHADVAAWRLGLLEVASLMDEDDLVDRVEGDEQRSDISCVSSKAMREATIDAMAFDTATSVESDIGLYHGMAPGVLDPVAGAALLASSTRRLAVSGSAFTGWSRVY